MSKKVDAMAKGTVIQVLADGKNVFTRELPIKLEPEQCISTDHCPDWGITMLRYPATEITVKMKAIEALLVAMRRPGWKIISAEVNLKDWEMCVHLFNEEVGEIDRVVLTDFQGVVEALSLLQYEFAVSPIGPRATGR